MTEQNGTVFKLNKDGSAYTILHVFSSAPGSRSPTQLVEGSDGALYGATREGGINNSGTVFKLNKDGSGYTALYSFKTNAHSGVLLRGSDGVLYGTSRAAPGYGKGAVFRFWPPQTPDMIHVTRAGDTAELTFTGVSGLQYQVLRSTNLPDFNVLGTITMPASGVYTNTDNLPPTPAAYYRAAWLP